jgi:hypothetical protein
MKKTHKHILRKNKTRKGGMNSPSNTTNSTKRPTNNNRNYFSNAKPEGFKGGGITQSRPRYPLLPETPTNKPPIKTNIEGLMNPPKESEEYQKRANRLRKSFHNARQQSLMNKLLGKERQEVPRNKYGPVRSYFSPNNKGFKPTPES